MSSTRAEPSSSAREPADGGGSEAESTLQVVATAGHVDHGKSSLILRLTGMDPDRWEEEKRRGLTIDLGFAWCSLPSGREVGFVDVPGHERFLRNMLAGVGPVRLVVFVVAADEGWKPQSEEHLSIVDLLGARGVVALTKADLVDAETRAIVTEEVRERLAGTVLEGAPVVACSSATGEGLDDLRAALDDLLAHAGPAPQTERPRLFVDRVFSIRGAGTVITGTLNGGCLSLGDEIVVLPAGRRARIRGLQTHKRSIDTACPVSRVAMNLVGIDREEIGRGDVVGRPGDWRASTMFEAQLRPIRGLDHPLTARGAYKLYVGSAELDARLRLLGTDSKLEAGANAFVRVRTSRPVVVDPFDGFVLREAGRRETVAGGRVLDVEPPRRPGPDPTGRLEARLGATREQLPDLLARERGAVRIDDARRLTGVVRMQRSPDAGEWIIGPGLRERMQREVADDLMAFHAEHPLREGQELATIRTRVADLLAQSGAPGDPALVDALLDAMVADGAIARTASAVRLAAHRVSLDARAEDVRHVREALEAAEPTPPTVPELVASGFSREVIEAAARGGALVRISNELALRPEFVHAAEMAVRSLADEATPITVSAFRERLGTSRKYAVPLLEHFDQEGLTRRDGDVRVLREP
jgi:selenocysteine-specific elongation factor